MKVGKNILENKIFPESKVLNITLERGIKIPSSTLM